MCVLALAGMVCLVVAVMYWLGWEMGAVEAISLHIGGLFGGLLLASSGRLSTGGGP